MSDKAPCGLLIKQLHDTLEKRANNALRSQDLTLTQGAALMALDAFDSNTASLKELEQALHIAQSTTVGIIARLEQKKLVESLISPTDKRINMVPLTAEGKACCQDAQKNMDDAERYLLASLTPKEQETFHQLLQKIAHHLT